VVLCTFSPARAWRPAVAARLARTLGCAIGCNLTFRAAQLTTAVQMHFSAFARCRRSFGFSATLIARMRSRATEGSASRSYVVESPCPVEEVSSWFHRRSQSVPEPFVGSGGGKSSISVGHQRSPCLLSVFMASWCPMQGTTSSAPRAQPNPSLKRSANGRLPGPPAAVVYSASVGPGTLPLSPA
jgi:hypothetical protein